jgi:N6-adenosine-specific RNA methylase IME4
VATSSVIHAPRREHSRKPDAAYEMIERMYPSLPKIELFARHERPGWAAWGNEIPCEAAE